MQQEIEPAPVLLDAREHGLELARNAHVAGHDHRGTQRVGDRLHEGQRLLVEIGDGEFCARLPEGRGATGGDAVLVGDADDEASLAGKIDDGVHAFIS